MYIICPKCGDKMIKYQTICSHCKCNLPITYDDSQEVIQVSGDIIDLIRMYPSAWLPRKVFYGRRSPNKLTRRENPWIVCDNTKGHIWHETFETLDDMRKWLNYEPVQNYFGKWLNL